MKTAIIVAAISLIVSTSPASARCGLLSWQNGDSRGGPFKLKTPKEMLAHDAAWCRSQMKAMPLNSCLSYLANHRDQRHMRETIIMRGLMSGPTMCNTQAIGYMAMTNCN
jgi:hypothetical protein